VRDIDRISLFDGKIFSLMLVRCTTFSLWDHKIFPSFDTA